MFGGGVFEDQIGKRESSGVGSGVVLRSDGYIVTNNHVVEGADELTVELSGGEVETGRLVGTDPQTDLAIVKIDRDDLIAVPFGDSDRIRVGDWVVAIGSPFGLDQTVTAGIISGKNRVQDIIADGKGFEDFLQTDAAHQSRQLRRSAGELARRIGRHQHRDHVPQRRQRGHRIRHSDLDGPTGVRIDH